MSHCTYFEDMYMTVVYIYVHDSSLYMPCVGIFLKHTLICFIEAK